jgi:hypothetical protein
MVTNGTGSAVSWSADLDLPAGYTITTSWDATRTGSGQHFTFTAPGWAGQLAPGASFSFGFNGSPGNFGGLAAAGSTAATATAAAAAPSPAHRAG